MLRRALEKAAGLAAARVDETFVHFAFRGRRARRRATRPAVGDRIREAEAFYGAAVESGRLFQTPAPAELVETPVREAKGGSVLDVTWPSRYEPLHESHRKTLERCPENATCHARWYRHAAPAPAIVCLHGWGAGHFAFEERAYVVPWLFGKLGLDVLLATLPFHWRRRPEGRRTPMFPSTDPMRANEGFAQATLDLRDLMLALRRRGASSVGVTGMSLGGFTSALLATVEPSLDFVVPIIPFASLPELLWYHGRGTAAQKRAESSGMGLERFALAFRATSPLHRAPVLDPRRMLIVAAEHDRVTPIEHAHRLHEHFVGSRLVTFPGSHLLPLGRAGAFREMARFVTRTV